MEIFVIDIVKQTRYLPIQFMLYLLREYDLSIGDYVYIYILL